MIFKNIAIVLSIALFIPSVVYSSDYTRYASWHTKPVPIPANPKYFTESRCSVYSNRDSFNSRLKNLGWSNSEALAKSINFNNMVAVLVVKKSFYENELIEFKSLYTEANKVVAVYSVKRIQPTSAYGKGKLVARGLIGHRPALVIVIPREIYNKGSLFCRQEK